MRSKQVHKERFLYIVFALLLLAVAVISGGFTASAFAETAQYTGVLDDLRKDEKFSISDYPANTEDYSLKVIQIAESVNGELFVYVYQPSAHIGKLVATDINMSLSESADASKLYSLKLLNNAGVFYKYKINGFEVSERSTRYYNITSIYREWLEGVDSEASYDNVINGVSFEVGQLWTVQTNGETVNYSMTYADTITVTDKFVGSVRYPNGVSWFTSGSCDSHFVAFSTDRRIDKLLEADVTFVAKSYDKNILGTTYGKEEKITPPTLKYDDVTSNKVNGIFAKTYSWKRIQSVSEFVSDKDFSTEAKAQISKQQWVLNFYETEYTSGGGGATAFLTGLAGALISSTFSSGTLVSEVTILRLSFETDGKTYNLGVVDNKQTGSDISIGEPENTGFNFWAFLGECFAKTFTGAGKWWQIAVVVVAIIVVISALALFVAWARWLRKKFKGE